MTIKEYIKTLSPEKAYRAGQIYGRTNGLPDEYRIVDFRNVKKGESFFSRMGEVIEATADETADDPRLILRKTVETVMVPPFGVTFKDVYNEERLFVSDPYQYVGFRYPQTGDLYIGLDRDIHFQEDGNKWPVLYGPRVILKKRN